MQEKKGGEGEGVGGEEMEGEKGTQGCLTYEKRLVMDCHICPWTPSTGWHLLCASWRGVVVWQSHTSTCIPTGVLGKQNT